MVNVISKFALKDATEVSKRLNIQISRLYSYINSDGSPQKLGYYLLNMECLMRNILFIRKDLIERNKF